MFFKIYGERNSGTNFLKKLLEKNFGNTYGNHEGNKIINDKYYFWKHGIPKNYTKNQKETKPVVKVFIFRRLEPWLVSMFHNPYHIKKIDTFDSFLKNKLDIRPHNHKYPNNVLVNIDDKNKSIFEIRYFKYNKIKEYCEKNENIILVNLEYLQNNENCIHFLNEINNKYNLNKTDFTMIEKHTKTSKNIKNIEYKTNYEEYQELINLYKIEKIENEINDLNFFIKITDKSVKNIYSKWKNN